MRSTLCSLMLVAVAPVALAAQFPDGLEPGETVRFSVTSEIHFQGTTGAVTSVDTLSRRVEGEVLLVEGDTLAVDQAGDERRFALTSLSDLQVLRKVEGSHARGFKRGAVRGGLGLGAVGAAIGICNPSIIGDEGCQGGGPELVLGAALVGAAVGALAGGILGGLFAPSQEWESVQISLPTRRPDGSVTLGVRVLPR